MSLITPVSRRSFLKGSNMAVAWMAAFQSAKTFAQQSPQAPTNAAVGETDSVAFWNQFFNPPKSVEGARRGHGQPRAKSATPGSQVEYVHLGPNGLRYVQDVKPEELPTLGGDVMLSVSPAEFRFGTPPSPAVWEISSIRPNCVLKSINGSSF